MKLGELVIAQQALTRLLALDFPAAVSYKIARAARPVQAELQNYEQERIKLVRRLGEDNGEGQIIVLPDKTAGFNEEMGALLNEDVELKIRTVDPCIFDKTDIKVRPGDLMLMWFLFEEKEEEPDESATDAQP